MASPEHLVKFRGKYQRTVNVLICRYCGEKFKSAHDWARYCSDAHRQADYRKRNEEQSHEQGEKKRRNTQLTDLQATK